MPTYQREITDYEALDAISLMIRLHDESRLTEADLQIAPALPIVPTALLQQPWPQHGLTVALPPALTSPKLPIAKVGADPASDTRLRPSSNPASGTGYYS